MVTIARIGGQVEQATAELYGLSTDNKPISDDIPNASTFYEMDTKVAFLYYAENKQWLEQ